MNIKETAERLASAGIRDALYEARLLAKHFLSIQMSTVVMLNETKLDFFAGYDDFAAAVEKRMTRYPLQYILGEWEFYGLPFYVNENCLIPRADTEVIAERAIEELKNIGGDGMKNYLDLCTGSGCIAAAVLKNVPNTFGYCVDIDLETAKLAEKNLDRNELCGRYSVIVGDAGRDLFDSATKFDLITANPPYISEDEMRTLEPELKYEPRIALTDSGDGLSFYEKIIRVYKNHLKPNGKLIFEHGYTQSDAVCRIATEIGMAPELIFDYGKRARGAVLQRIY
ncbi:MAG: peptide chain release factor N(5)-glutamine methyltransferase [Eubacteriales bacterium]